MMRGPCLNTNSTIADAHGSGQADPPETPAPVFAVRAFKHALFGTPQTTQPKPRRNSNLEAARPRTGDSRPPRPRVDRPKSASDANALTRAELRPPPEPGSSPTKGILMTPGTAAARKKNVTFGDHVLDNEGKRPLRSGLPEDCPGKFPSPWTKGENFDKQEADEQSRGRSKLTEALEQVRDESRRGNGKTDGRGKNALEGEADATTDFDNPQSESGKYWKCQYDIYRKNTQREVKKLIMKQKAAKSYAKAKDEECNELLEDMRQEREQVESLQADTTRLNSQVKQLEEKLKATQEREARQQALNETLERQLAQKTSTGEGDNLNTRRGGHVRRGSDERKAVVLELGRSEAQGASNGTGRGERQRPGEQSMDASGTGRDPARRAAAHAALPSQNRSEPPDDTETAEFRSGPVQQPSDPSMYQSAAKTEPAGSETHRRANGPSKNAGRAEPQPDRDDQLAQLFHTPNISTTRLVPAEKDYRRPLLSHNSSRAVTSGTGATPLKMLSINARSNDAQQNDQQFCNTTRRDLAEEVKDRGQAHPVKASSPDVKGSANESQPCAKSLPKSSRSDESSSSRPDTKASALKSSIGSSLTGPRPAPSTLTKENVAPSSRPPAQTAQSGLNAKPSAVWSSFNSTQAGGNTLKFGGGRRTTSAVGKDGKEVDVDRLEAAKARLMARGRIVS